MQKLTDEQIFSLAMGLAAYGQAKELTDEEIDALHLPIAQWPEKLKKAVAENNPKFF